MKYLDIQKHGQDESNLTFLLPKTKSLPSPILEQPLKKRIKKDRSCLWKGPVPAGIALPLVWVIHEHRVCSVDGSSELSERRVTGSGCVPDWVPDWELHTQFLYELQPLLTEMMRTLVTEENLRRDKHFHYPGAKPLDSLDSHRRTKGRFTGRAEGGAM